MRFAPLVLPILALTACAPSTELDSGVAADAGILSDSGVPNDADVVLLPPGCAGDTPEGCAYAPESPLDQLAVQTQVLAYDDVTGATRTIEIAVRRPDGGAASLPVVVWSHGGADGTVSADGVGAAWSRVFTSAGYLFIGIAHRGRDAAERAALCDELGYDSAGCMTFKFLSWDRPHDLRAVLDWLETGPLAGSIDASRIAYAGHSAGAGAVMMVAGASRDFAGTQRTLPDARPVAFLACSPQGPGEDGFVAESFDAIARPHLTLSGTGDDTAGTVAEDRRVPFTRMAESDKYLGWIDDEGAAHTMFNYEIDACARHARNNGLDEARCETFRIWLGSAALAFLDAHVQGDPDARAYLASDALEVLSASVMEWSRR